MNKRLIYLISGLSCGAALAGCVCSEREVAKSIDFTPQIIQQGSDLIAADPELGHLGIVLDGFKDDMRLKGAVRSQEQKERAGKLIWAVPHVKSVKNDLKVAGQDKATAATKP